jgi:hypothetical protein
VHEPNHLVRAAGCTENDSGRASPEPIPARGVQAAPADPHGPDVVEIGNRPFRIALLASGANVNAANDAGVTPLMIASMAACADAVRTLLEKAPGTDITADTTRLVRVAWSGHPDIMLTWFASRAGRARSGWSRAPRRA